MEEEIAKKDYREVGKGYGFEDLQMRGLCIVTYLRCLQAYVSCYKLSTDQDDFRATQEDRKERCKRVKTDLVKITNLCSTTGWFEAGVGRRYLKLMCQIFAMRPEEVEISDDHIEMYEIVSNVCNTILLNLRDKISEKTSLHLSKSDKQLIMYLIDTYTYL